MGTFLGIDFDSVIGATTGQAVYDLTITRRTTGSMVDGSLTDGAQTDDQDYPARGYANGYTVREIDGTRIQQGDRRVTIYPSAEMRLDEIEPEPDDIITITTQAGEERLLIVAIDERAPSGALYRVQARKA